MAGSKKLPYQRNVQIAMYTPAPLYNLVVREAQKRRRKLGPTCMEILWEYFESNKQIKAAS